MKKIGIIFFLLLCLVFFQCYLGVPVNGYYNKQILQEGFSSTGEKVDLFRNILDSTNSKPTECGVMAVFTTEGSGEKAVDEISIKLDKYYKLNKKVSKNNEAYSIYFNNDSIDGYIQSVNYENYNVITVNIIKICSTYELEDIKSNIKMCLSGQAEKCRYFEYVKAKVEKGNVDAINKQVKSILEYWNTCNIKTIPLEDGYTSTAYTGRYESIQSEGNLIDFNYAVMKYDMGTYIIMGTPEIMETY
ncbi:hypothetical protein ACJDU8_08200 [Clostridium sp. WILCCON 0269]|uniref:TATA-box binding n=1 Tax=Candidatus Clostridium eludens TaxID=3381663 RepID=A0ABW8SIL7_9CLOT